MLITRNIPGILKPFSYQVGLDWSHPLTRGLAFATIFGDSYSPVDYVGNGPPGTPQSSPSITTLSTAGIGSAAAIGAYGGGASAYFDFVHSDDSAFTGDLSIVWRGVLASAGAGGFYHFAGKHTGGGGTNNPFDFRTNNANPPSISPTRGNAGGADSAGALGTVSLDVVHTVGWTSPGSSSTNNWIIYIDGTDTGTRNNGGARTPYTGVNADIRIGRRADGVVQLVGAMQHVFIWSRILSATEMRMLHFAPYQMFRSRRLSMLMHGTYAAGGATPWLYVQNNRPVIGAGTY